LVILEKKNKGIFYSFIFIEIIKDYLFFLTFFSKESCCSTSHVGFGSSSPKPKFGSPDCELEFGELDTNWIFESSSAGAKTFTDFHTFFRLYLINLDQHH
jgi:hypothetical protein